MLPNVQAPDASDSIGMDGLPNYWGELSHRQDDAPQGAMPLLDANMQMTLWIPIYSPQASVAPIVFQRANTAPVQVCTDCVVENEVAITITR
jgi:hypothetical protein